MPSRGRSRATGPQSCKSLVLTFVALPALLGMTGAYGLDRTEQANSGWAINLDNDLFALRHQDRDYTGGASVTFAGARVQGWFGSLDPALSRINRLIRPSDDNNLRFHSLQIGIAAFSPEDISRSDVVANDRPYAGLVYLSNAQMSLLPDGRHAIQSALTVGVLGSTLPEQLQKIIHTATGSDPPQGWPHQISRGGEPTARYALAWQHLWVAPAGGGLEIKQSLEGSLGFLTEAGAAVSVRWGRIGSPWWSFMPERPEYFAQPTLGMSTNNPGHGREMYVWAGAKLRVRVYNAFLQGQFRESPLTYGQDEIRPLLVQVWLGVTRQVDDHNRLSWVWRYQSSEVNTGHGDREVSWGSLVFNHDF